MKKSDLILSFLYPVTVETTSSQWNPHLEVVLAGGKYVLNSANSNYSYGSLYLLFEKIFRKTELDWESVHNVLVLGFGAGGAADIINRYGSDCRIDGVEIDAKVIELGRKYFKTDLLKNVSLHCTSAEDYISGCKQKYDLIVIDVYNDLNVPEIVESKSFLLGVRGVLNEGGTVIFNKFVHDRKSQDQVKIVGDLYNEIFGNLEILTIMLTGKIFISRKRTTEL